MKPDFDDGSIAMMVILVISFLIVVYAIARY
jgi:hypothetical protein